MIWLYPTLLLGKIGKTYLPHKEMKKYVEGRVSLGQLTGRGIRAKKVTVKELGHLPVYSSLC
jgi:hypothetical protein